MARMKLEVRFKGGRQYVHGTDLFDEVTRTCREAYGGGFLSDIEFKSFVSHGVTLVPDEALASNEAPFGRCRFVRSSQPPVTLHLLENRRAVLERIAYDEEAIVESAIFDIGARTVVSPVSTAATRIEQLVAMNKALHYRLWPAPSGRWAFTRLKLEEKIETVCDELGLEVGRVVANRFTEAKIVYDGLPIGKMSFMVAL